MYWRFVVWECSFVDLLVRLRNSNVNVTGQKIEIKTIFALKPLHPPGRFQIGSLNVEKLLTNQEIFRIRLSLLQITFEHPFTNVAIAPAPLVSLTMPTLSIQTHNMNWKVFSLSNCCNMSCEKILTLSHGRYLDLQTLLPTGNWNWMKTSLVFLFFHCYTFKLNSCCFGQNLPMKW